MPETVYLIDTMAYVFRSFFAMRSMSAPDGTPINAVFGLGMTLLAILGGLTLARTPGEPGALAGCEHGLDLGLLPGLMLADKQGLRNLRHDIGIRYGQGHMVCEGHR